ncbi:branched-chain amino acid transporter AzlD [Selenomonas sp. oral taxon 920]|uniref:branched-chain amino acid transporter permease n=1 Tax=Selenomonas sp. oral taxon 920 TaxID=1884263 RepID=UPI000840AC4A|nr:branched-chain amino acid transporter permease [Selenomonas sp. oral taxon 920]AOH47773.1 branched-chain amino acid transporter AzlD [Selenomonas sp. oral taxon 920]
MTFTEQCITIGLCALASVLTRALPFLLLSEKKPTPPIVRYLGNVLPAAVFGMLVVYCLKDTSFLSGNHGLPEITGVIVTAALHLRFRQMLLSIGGGTMIYMILIQYIFIP